MSGTPATIDDIWLSLQAEERSRRVEYKNRYDSINKKSSEHNDFNLVELMNKIGSNEEKKKKKSTANGKKISTEKNVLIAKSNEPVVESRNEISKVLISASELSNRISRHVLGCDSNESSIRRKSLTHLYEECFVKYTLTPQDYSSIFQDVSRSIFRLFSDNLESCREISIHLTLKFFKNSVDIVPVLSFFFPALMHRLPHNIGYDDELRIFVYDKESHEAYKRGKAVDRQDRVNSSEASLVPFTFTEPSEEIRLLSYQMIRALLDRMIELDALSILQPYFNEIVMFLQIGLRDPYPNVKQLTLETLELLSKQVQDFEMGLKFFAIALCRAIMPVLRHRHAKIRAAAVSCLTAYFIVPDKAKRKGAGTDAIVDLIGFHEENVLSIAAFYKPQVQINYLAELVMDNTVQVREATVKMLDVLLSELPDRHDHASRLLPYLLDFLTDENHDDVVQIALNCLVKCGKLYEEEHQEDIIERRQYGVDGDKRMNFTKPLPYPFNSQRPRLGIRLFVRGHVKRFLSVLIKEIMNWKGSTRIKSVKLLKIAVILSEESITIDAANIFPALLKAMQFTKYEENDTEVYKVLLDVSELIGRYIHPDVYLHYLLPRLRGDIEIVGGAGVDSNTRFILLEFIRCLSQGTKNSEFLPYLSSYVDCICDEYVISRESTILQSKALEALSTVLVIVKSEIDNSDSSLEVINAHIKEDFLSKCFEFLIQNLVRSQSVLQNSQQGVKDVIEALNNLGYIFSKTMSCENIKSENCLRNLFLVQGKKLLMKLISEVDSGSLQDNIDVILSLIGSPFSVAHQDLEVFKLSIGYFEESMALLLSQLDGKSFDITTLSMKLSSGLCSLLVPVTCGRYIVLTPYFRTVDNQFQTLQNKLRGDLMETICFEFTKIVKYFIQNRVWSNSVTFEDSRLRLVGYLLGSLGQSRDGSEIVNEHLSLSLLDITSIDQTRVFVLESIVPTLRSCKQPTYPSSMRISVVQAIEEILKQLAQKANLSFEKLKPHSSLKDKVEYYIIAQPVINLLFELINDGSDVVQRQVISAFLVGSVFVLPDDESCEYPTFTTIARSLLNEITRHNVYFLEIEMVLRSFAVLNPIKLEELVRETFSTYLDLSPDSREVLNDLIDHASLIAQFQSA